MDILNQLINTLRSLPGIGPKSAQRLVYYLLQHQRSQGLHLAQCLKEAMENIRHCQRCNNFTEMTVCDLCQSASRDSGLLCVVESPADLYAIQQSNSYHGHYFVLMGKISPLDGIAPEDIGLQRLYERVNSEKIGEVILALGASIEGQITIQFIYDMLSGHSVHISQLAHGIPSGGELELLDGVTIGSALRNRAPIAC